MSKSVIRGELTHVDGVKSYIHDETAQDAFDAFNAGLIAPNGILNFGNSTILVANLVRIDWIFE